MTAVVDAPFGLQEAKFAVPPARPGTVAKAEVVARLCRSHSPLTTVLAPAGYGKTTLLARWAQVDPRPFAWVAFDAHDDDALVFLRCIAMALHRIQPLPHQVFDALSEPGGTTLTSRVPQVGSALANVARPLVLALDDLHAVASTSCLDVLAALVEYVPDGSRIAVASREAPALPLGRWRAQGSLDEISVGDLRLDEDEAGQLLAAANVDLDAGEISALVDRTEGWPAGLYLAALSLRAGAPTSTDAASFAGDDRFVSDYFRQELLSRLPAAEARFLQRSSVLDRMCGSLCDSVLQTKRSARVLEGLEGTNCFVVPLDRRGEWYRYHHLFGELLRDELGRSETPGMVRALNGRAMAWCIAHDEQEAAVLYGQAAGETDTVAGLVEALALPLYYDGRMETLEEWLGWFDEEQLARYPALAVCGAWLRMLTGRHTAAERWLALAEGATTTVPLSDGSASIEPWVANLRACMMRDGVEAALADGDLALKRFAAESAWRPAALVVRGTAHALLGAEQRATDDLVAAAATGREFGSADVVFVAEAQLALLALKRGSWAAAGERAGVAAALVEETGLRDYSTSAIVHVTAARVALHEGRRDDARAALARAHRLRPLLDEGVPWLTIQVGLELTRAHLALADPGAARTVLDETERVISLRPSMGLLVEEARELRERVEASVGPSGAWAMSLTAAEIRLLPYLATHLTFPEIAGRLFISRNTAKTEAISIYRKLGASSRSEAIERAVEVGLLESSIYPPRATFTLDG
ncbi:LuxR C-terminal-related transcriptional regulator [Conexibacter stalactiti]|uniref:LuxR C-terminal-related transcriptional regulator n=1 Tax=Conexibacter stalactiti TaxID=1940611 RepID=A0ABU4HST9_9ACTN|nr:LuxR C-terminal-related transcriptional regulator [Conexibacter stalactiti]MDW5596259.1 LuxR C-terminal-related transcriptional regulator [Conexibacter stalactiti]MEC5036901.1 LuxR C-terminal-related transcriptional regulator [Conexibacter stalactiti]